MRTPELDANQSMQGFGADLVRRDGSAAMRGGPKLRGEVLLENADGS